MWCLVSQNDSRILYIVLQEKALTVGRILDSQSSHFAAIEDASISRKHATLSILQNNLYIQDLGSRYGTFVNQFDEKIGTTSKVQLNHNDVVKFGKLNSVWTVKEIKHVTCTSTLKGENLVNLKVVLDQLGGTLKSDWDGTCMYLTMPAITLTIKVVLALVQGSCIVTTQFWNECLNAVNNGAALPDPKKFTPQVIESTINKDEVTFLPDERRSKLFTGRKFIFFSRRQLEMYKMVLLNSAATPLLLSESKMTKSMLCSPDVVVIQYNIGNTSQESQAQRNQINDIVNYLKSKGRRAVADAEIGLAILYFSTNKYCNPDFSFTSEVFKQPPASIANANVLAQQTQETTQAVQCKKENVVINESLTPNHNNFDASNVTSLNTAGNSKRKLSGEISEVMNANKKMATELSSQQKPTHTDSTKRKLNDEEVQMNPNKKRALNNADLDGQDDFFNFIDSNTDTAKLNKTTEKKLNFFKPTKRGASAMDSVSNEDDLFNFVQDNSKSACTKQPTIKKMFDMKNTHSNNGTSIGNNNQPNNSNADKDESEDEELHSIMRDLDLGSTIVKLKKDLIVKKEPLEIVFQSDGPNFKKFKKVWPIKMHVTIIPKSSMSIVRPGGFNATEMSTLSMSDDE